MNFHFEGVLFVVRIYEFKLKQVWFTTGDIQSLLVGHLLAFEDLLDQFLLLHRPDILNLLQLLHLGPVIIAALLLFSFSHCEILDPFNSLSLALLLV